MKDYKPPYSITEDMLNVLSNEEYYFFKKEQHNIINHKVDLVLIYDQIRISIF